MINDGEGKEDLFTPKDGVIPMPVNECQHFWTFFTVRKRKWLVFGEDVLCRGCRSCGTTEEIF